MSNVVCGTCGLVFISPRPPSEDISELYLAGGFSTNWRGARLPSEQKITRSEEVALRRFLRWAAVAGDLNLRDQPNGQPRRALEIGCGVGSFLRLVRGAGWDVSGIEPDPGYAGSGQALYDVEIAAALYEDRPAPSGSLDLIASFHVLEHVPSPKAFLEQAHNELSDDGLLFIEVPSIDRPYGGNLDRFFWSAHLTSFSRSTLLAYLRQAGFEAVWHGFAGDFVQVIARKAAPQTLHFPIDPPKQRRAQVRAKGTAYKLLRKGPLARPVGWAKRVAVDAYAVGRGAPHVRNRTVEGARRAWSEAGPQVRSCRGEAAFVGTGDSAHWLHRALSDAGAKWSPAQSHAEIQVVAPALWTPELLGEWSERARATRVIAPAMAFDRALLALNDEQFSDLVSPLLASAAYVGVRETAVQARLARAGHTVPRDVTALASFVAPSPRARGGTQNIGLALQPWDGRGPDADAGWKALAAGLQPLSAACTWTSLAMAPSDGEAAPWLLSHGIWSKRISTVGSSAAATAKIIASVGAWITNRPEVADAARAAGIPALILPRDSTAASLTAPDTLTQFVAHALDRPAEAWRTAQTDAVVARRAWADTLSRWLAAIRTP